MAPRPHIVQREKLVIEPREQPVASPGIVAMTRIVEIDAEIKAMRVRYDALDAERRDLVTACSKTLFDSCPVRITLREKEVLSMIVADPRIANKEIASKLFVSTRMVKQHVSNMLRKFKVSSRLELDDAARLKGATLYEERT